MQSMMMFQNIESDTGMVGGYPLVDKHAISSSSSSTIGGGDSYDRFVVPVGLYTRSRAPKRNVKETEDSSPDIPLIPTVLFDRLFGMVGHEVNEKGKRKTQKKR